MNHEPQTFADLQDVGNAQSQLILQAVARHADWDTGVCFPSVAVLARMGKCSDKTARRHLSKLQADGFIVIEEREREDGSQGANKITLAGYAEWIKANRAGGNVAPPRKARRYEQAPEAQQNGPGHIDQGVGQSDQGGNADEPNEKAPVNLTREPDKMTRGPGQQVTTPKNPFTEQDSPQPPNGGLSAKPVEGKWKDDVLAALRERGRHRDALEHLIAPLLASDKRVSLGKGLAAAVDALAELAQAAHGIPQPALAAALARLIAHKQKLTPRLIRDEIDHARKGGAMVVVRRGTPQFRRWQEHFTKTDPRQSLVMARQDTWQVPSEWPPAINAGRDAA